MSGHFWSQQRVVVTGGAGFLGNYVVEKLIARGCQHIFSPRKAENDLRRLDASQRLYAEARPSLVIHLAAVVGGIGANRERRVVGYLEAGDRRLSENAVAAA